MIDAATAGGTILGSGVTSGSKRLLCALAANLQHVRRGLRTACRTGAVHLLFELASGLPLSSNAEQTLVPAQELTVVHMPTVVPVLPFTDS